MEQTPSSPHRKATALRGYDYARGGGYAVTLCVQRRLALFGSWNQGVLERNDAGDMIANEWMALPTRFPHVTLDTFVIMTDHLHGILLLNDESASPITLHMVIGAFKSLTTLRYITGVQDHQWAPFCQRLWQRSFYDHLIRSDADLQRIRAYIADNPLRPPTS